MRSILIAVLLMVAAGAARSAVPRTDSPVQAASEAVVVFHNVRVFDGERVLPGAQTVVVRNGRIAAIGPAAATAIPDKVDSKVEGDGTAFLLPGLIDAHTHVYGDALKQALIFGVTTELDMFTDFRLAAAMRAEQAAGKGQDRADLFSAGILVTAPGGHGTEYGFPIPTLTKPEDAQAFVDARIAEGSDYIKIILDDGRTYGIHIPTIDDAALRAVVAAAHKRGRMAVVHVGSYADAREAIEAGADGLMHLFVDKAPDADFGRFAAAHHIFVVPTLAVLESVSGGGGRAHGTALTKPASLLAPYLTLDQAANLAKTFPVRPGSPPRSYPAAEAAVKILKDAHVPILAGTDSPNPGTAHGASLHHEMELLVDAGLTPTEALAAATSVPASRFHLADRGRIAVGLRADLLLLKGDPTSDILKTREILGVWKLGIAADRAAYLVAREKERAPAPAVASADAKNSSGLVSDFDDNKIASRFGSGWAVSTDTIAGGKSDAAMSIMPGGAEGSPYALSVTGTVAPGLAYAWSGVMFSPGPQMFAPFDLSNRKSVSFWAKSDGKRTYEVMFFSQGKGQLPLIKTFTPGAAWKEFSFQISEFGGIDGHDVMAIVFAAGPNPGPFSSELHSIRFR